MTMAISGGSATLSSVGGKKRKPMTYKNGVNPKKARRVSASASTSASGSKTESNLLEGGVENVNEDGTSTRDLAAAETQTLAEGEQAEMQSADEGLGQGQGEGEDSLMMSSRRKSEETPTRDANGELVEEDPIRKAER